MSTFLIFSTVQGVLIAIDEFVFHHRRYMPRWERIGHPVDTFTVLFCFMFLILTEPSNTHRQIYYGLATISCLMISKDEWAHKKYCQASEMWLHALLFIMHPLILLSALAEWPGNKMNLYFVGAAILPFFFYQIIYWNFSATRIPSKRSISMKRRKLKMSR